jgi:hypothetical protein
MEQKKNGASMPQQQPGDPVQQPDIPRPQRDPIPGTPEETPEERPGRPGQDPDPTRIHPSDPDPKEPIGY